LEPLVGLEAEVQLQQGTQSDRGLAQQLGRDPGVEQVAGTVAELVLDQPQVVIGVVKDLSDRLRTVPSELRADGSTLAGRVHDPNAQALGGVAGHAGVFATGTDLAHFAQKWLRGLRGTDSTWLSPATYSLFAQRGQSTGTRAL